MDEAVAVVTPYPVFRRGLFETLRSSGFVPEDPVDLLRWLDDRAHHVVLIAAKDGSVTRSIAEVRRRCRGVVVVVLLAEPTPALARRMLAAGACSVAGWDVSSDELHSMLDAGLHDRSVLPVELIRQLAIGIEDGASADLSDRETEWLRALGSGTTVCRLAERSGYSERAMYRLLAKLYAHIGVQNRTQALVWAAQRGLID